MAKQTFVIDDLSGDSGAKTRRFSIDGAEYEIDLTDASYASLKAALKPFIKVARSTGAARARANAPARRAKVRKGRSGGAKTSTEAAVIRAWARANGMAVTERGRVAPELKAAWAAAGSPR